MKLYEISQDLLSFMEQIDAGEIPEEAIDDTLGSLYSEFDVAADDLASAIKSLRAEAAAIKEEAEHLTARRRSKEARADRFVQYLMRSMTALNREKIETPRNHLKLGKCPPKVEVTNLEDFVSWALENNRESLNHKPPEPNKTVIKTMLQQGAEIPGVSLEQDIRLSIK